MATLEQYLDIHPLQAWNRDTWSEYDAMVDTRFHEADIFFTPLADYRAFPTGVGLNQYMFTGREMIQSHTNHNPLGWYQRYTDSIYVDTRERRLQSRLHYGGKAQWDKNDELVTRFGNDTDSFIKAAMNAQLLNQVAEVHEKIARDSLLRFAQHKFLGDLTPYDSTHNFSSLAGTGTNMFDIKYLEEMSLRMAIRSREAKKQFGDYANPVPGQNFRDSVLISVPTSVYYDIWNSTARDWMVNLRELGDQRIINGGMVQYRNITVQDYGPHMSLWNAGPIYKQCEVVDAIKWGDGAPDPETEMVDNIFLTGQGGGAVKHYIQLKSGSFIAGDFNYGDFINIHVKRTSEFGVTNGCDVLDGKTITVEVLSADVTNQRLVVRKPITEAYDTQIEAGVYAYVTKARHVYPVYAIGARGMMVWAGRTKVEWNRPSDEAADYPSIERVTWHERGEMNKWDIDLFEIVFCEGSFANRGGVSIV